MTKQKKEYTRKDMDQLFEIGFTTGFKVAMKDLIKDLEDTIAEWKLQEGIMEGED
jgi:hypothetical protein